MVVMAMMSKLVSALFGVVLLCGPIVNGMAVLVESKVKREALNKFALNIVFIDAVLQQDLRIDFQAAAERWQMRWRLLRVVAMVLLTWVTFYFVWPSATSLSHNQFFSGLMVFLWPSTILAQLFFFRNITFVHAIGHRYRLVNERIQRLHRFNDDNFLTNEAEACLHLNSGEIVNMLQNMRRIHRLLYWATQTMNGFSSYSLSLFMIQIIFFGIIQIKVTVGALSSDDHLPLQAHGIMWLVLLPLFMSMMSFVSSCDSTMEQVYTHVFSLILVQNPLRTGTISCFNVFQSNHTSRWDFFLQTYLKRTPAHVREILH